MRVFEHVPRARDVRMNRSLAPAGNGSFKKPRKAKTPDGMTSEDVIQAQTVIDAIERGELYKLDPESLNALLAESRLKLRRDPENEQAAKDVAVLNHVISGVNNPSPAPTGVVLGTGSVAYAGNDKPKSTVDSGSGQTSRRSS